MASVIQKEREFANRNLLCSMCRKNPRSEHPSGHGGRVAVCDECYLKFKDTREFGRTRKDPAAVSLGRRGGIKGGAAQAAKIEQMTPMERKQFGRELAKKRKYRKRVGF